MKRPKRIPQRTCVGCRKVTSKRGLIRVVRLPEGRVEVDATGKRSGRGAYLCPLRTCWELAMAKRRLDHALRTTLSPQEQDHLWEYGRSLPSEGGQ